MPQSCRPCVATIGNFDGMHLGHQALLKAVKTKAQEHGLLSSVILFEPHPKEYFLGDQAPARLMTLRDKCEFLRDFGIDQVFCLRFDKFLAQMLAAKFIEDILVRGVQVRALVVGHDFRFGHKRQGDLSLLRDAARGFGYEVEAMSPVLWGELGISSSTVRAALKVGDFVLAEKLLGHDFVLSGRVRRGQGFGQDWGFPTANLHLKQRIIPVAGVFAAKVGGEGWSEPKMAAVSIGRRPMVGGGDRLLEAYLLDFEGELYGKRLDIVLCSRLREQCDFAGLVEMQAQIGRDVEAVRTYFSERS